MKAPILALPIGDRDQSLDLAYENLTAPVARRISRMRRRARLTRHDLAIRLDSTDSFVTRLETGGAAITARRVRKVARALSTREELFYPNARPDVFWNQVENDLQRYL
jgi:transcriptional regulator with XRE-family HTH domain